MVTIIDTIKQSAVRALNNKVVLQLHAVLSQNWWLPVDMNEIFLENVTVVVVISKDILKIEYKDGTEHLYGGTIVTIG